MYKLYYKIKKIENDLIQLYVNKYYKKHLVSKPEFQKMAIKSILIPCIEAQYTAEYIAKVIRRLRIAEVSNITLYPYFKNNKVFQIACVDIANWCDSEVAYNFIQSLKNSKKETRLVHFSDNWWPVEIKRSSKQITNYRAENNKLSFIVSYTEFMTNMDKDYDKDNDKEKMFDRAVNNSQHVTLRKHQKHYKIN